MAFERKYIFKGLEFSLSMLLNMHDNPPSTIFVLKGVIIYKGPRPSQAHLIFFLSFIDFIKLLAFLGQIKQLNFPERHYFLI